MRMCVRACTRLVFIMRCFYINKRLDFSYRNVDVGSLTRARRRGIFNVRNNHSACSAQEGEGLDGRVG